MPTTVQLTLEILRGSEPISGSILVAGEAGRPFAGWIDLVALVQEAITGDPERSGGPVREEKDR